MSVLANYHTYEVRTNHPKIGVSLEYNMVHTSYESASLLALNILSEGYEARVILKNTLITETEIK